jgi:hypothetical protein
MVYVIHSAIGRSTNLISPDSNIIIVRKGSRPIRTQVLNALEEFFPEDMAKWPPSERLSGEEPVPLQRINTGVSTIVGADNGNRDGGFVLVVDDSALLDVNKLQLIESLSSSYEPCRLLRTMRSRKTYFVLLSSVKASSVAASLLFRKLLS